MTSITKYNGQLAGIFNYHDVVQPETISNLNTGSILSDAIRSTTIRSTTMRVVNGADENDVVTDAELATAIAGVKAEIIGSASAAFDTLGELQAALSSNPDAYASLVTSIGTKAAQTSLDTTNTNVSTISTNVSALQAKTTNLSYSGGTSTFSGTVAGVSKGMVGLGNVDNTSDLNKPISTLTQAALDGKQNSLSFDSAPTASSSNPVTSGGVHSVLATKAAQSALDTTNTNVTNLQSKTSALAFDSGTNTLTVQSKLICSLSETNVGNTQIGDASSDLLTVMATPTFSSGLTVSAGTVSVPSASIAQAAVNGLTSALAAKAAQTSLDTTNTNVTNLQNKTSALTYNSGTNTLTVQSKLICTLDELQNGNTTIGDASTDLLTVNATPTFNNGLTIASGSVSVPSASIAQAAVNGLSTALTARALDTATCHNTNAETWAGVKTFSSSPIVPTASAGDNSTKAASTAYCDSAVATGVANLVNSAPAALDTLNEFATALGNDAAFSTTVTNNIAGKASLTSNNTYTGNQTYNTGTCTFNNGLSANAITLNSVNLNTRIANIESKSDKFTYDAGTDTLTVSSKMTISKDVSDVGSIYLGDGVGADIIYVRGNISSNSQVVTPAQLGYVSGATSNLQMQITARALDSAVCHLAASETLTGAKTFSGGVTMSSNITANACTITPTELSYIDGVTSGIQQQLDGKQATLSFDSSPTSSSSNPVTSGGVYTALATKQATLSFDSTPTSSSTNPVTSGGVFTALATKQATLSFDSTPSSSSSNPVTSGGVYTALSGKQASLTFDSTPTSSSSNPVTSGGVFTALAGKQATLSFDSTPTSSSTNPVTSGGTYTALQSYGTLAGSNTYSGNNTLSGYTHVNEIAELVNSVTSITTSASLDYTTCKGINYIQTPTANYSLALTNVPSPPGNKAVYNLVLCNTSKYYCSSITVNGTSRTIVFSGGSPTINASATLVMQQISICYLNSATPTVVSSVNGLW
jgi:hypothetical protein